MIRTDPGYPRQAHLAEILDHHRQGIFECGCGTPISSTTWNWHVAMVIDNILQADERITTKLGSAR